MTAYGNFPVVQPDISYKGKAWRIPSTHKSTDPAHQANIDNWLVCAEGFNAYAVGWWYMVMLAHLRPIEGVDPAHLQYPDATHEVVFATLNPDKPLPTLGKWEFVEPLQPFDLIHQFTVRGDDQAKSVVEMLIHHICEGQSPDQDNREYWQVCITNTAEHLMYDGHPSRN